MSTSRQSKWDWNAHFPLMEKLYNAKRSIPDICKAIQCEDFMPCQRAVYDKFHSEGYSTQPSRRYSCSKARPLGSMSTAIGGLVTKGSSSPMPPSYAERERPYHSEISSQQVAIPGQAPLQKARSTLQTLEISKPHASLNNYQLQRSNLDNAIECSCSTAATTNTREEFTTASHGINSTKPIETRPLQSVQQVSPKAESATTTLSHEERQVLRDKENEIFVGSLVNLGVLPSSTLPSRRPNKPPHTTKANMMIVSLQSKQTTNNRASKIRTYQMSPPEYHSRHITKLHSLFKPKTRHPAAAITHQRLFDETDFGHFSASGRIPNGSTESCPPSYHSSQTEFRGLYRVACHTLHDPDATHQYRDIPLCNHCGYSSIFNLAWSSRHLGISVYLAELQLQDFYDVGVIDAAGNSALHYAAASGAGYVYMKALIFSGVRPSQINTAGQSFLHCLRPYNVGSDCFNSDLIALLNLVQPELAFGQQDNDGRTILHSLAEYIIEPCLRMQTFKYFSEHGYPPNVLDRFGKTAKDIIPSAYNFGQTMIDTETINTVNGTCSASCEPATMSEWELQEWRSTNAQINIEMAETNPHHIDIKTRDTALHAMSRSMMDGKSILHKIKRVVSGGLELNRHNLEGHHPLSSFVCNQDSRRKAETGADMAKYFDAILWRDRKHQFLNNINVNMKCRNGTTALYEASIRAQVDCMRSLIEAGANVNARSDADENRASILQATLNARDRAVLCDDRILLHMFKEAISHLEHAGAVRFPTSLQERGHVLELLVR